MFNIVTDIQIFTTVFDWVSHIDLLYTLGQKSEVRSQKLEAVRY